MSNRLYSFQVSNEVQQLKLFQVPNEYLCFCSPKAFVITYQQSFFTQKLKIYANTTLTKLIIFMLLTLTFSKFCCEPQQVRYSVDVKGWLFGY